MCWSTVSIESSLQSLYLNPPSQFPFNTISLAHTSHGKQAHSYVSIDGPRPHHPLLSLGKAQRAKKPRLHHHHCEHSTSKTSRPVSLPPPTSFSRSSPSAAPDHGHPPEAENTDSVPRREISKLVRASGALQSHFERFISDIIQNDGHPPLCIIADVFVAWTVGIAKKLGIFHVTFTTCGACGTAAYMSLYLHLPHRHTDSPEIRLLGFPETFRLTGPRWHRTMSNLPSENYTAFSAINRDAVQHRRGRRTTGIAGASGNHWLACVYHWASLSPRGENTLSEKWEEARDPVGGLFGMVGFSHGRFGSLRIVWLSEQDQCFADDGNSKRIGGE